LIRARGDSASTEFSLHVYGKRITLRYSTETDGGSFDVWMDGGFSRSISWAGAQSVNNESTWTFTAIGHHTIKFMAPASGYAYIETLESCQDKNGIQVIDATHGGSSLRNMVVVQSPAGAQVAGIPISGYTVLDGHFNNVTANYKPDLFIFAWCVNDAGLGMGNYTSYYQPALQRIVDLTKALNTPLILVVEMGGAYAMTNHANHATFEAIRAQIRSYATLPHVTVIDWHALSDPYTLGIPAWAARYYPSAVYNEVAGTVTSGDFIHPNNYGQALLAEALSVKTAVTPTGQIGLTDGTQSQYTSALAPVLSNRTLEAYSDKQFIGARRIEANNMGIVNDYTCIGYSSNFTMPLTDISPLFLSEREHNLGIVNSSMNSAVAASTTSDEYGKYLMASNKAQYIYPGSSGDTTVTVVVGPGAWRIRTRDYNNTVGLEHFSKGASIGVFSDIAGNNTTDKPQVMHFTVRYSSFYTTWTGKIYALYVTPTSFPCITLIEGNLAREISGPLYMTSDLASAAVVLGQIYWETVNSKTVEKVAIGRRVYKANDSNYYGLYRVQNRTMANLIRNLSLSGSVTLNAYDDVFGGQSQTTTLNPPVVSLGAIINSSFADQLFTLAGKLSGYVQVAFYLFDGGTNNVLHYNPITNTWIAGLYNTNNQIFNLRDGEMCAITFNMPTAAQLGAATWSLNLRQFGGSAADSKWGVFTLVDGSSACV